MELSMNSGGRSSRPLGRHLPHPFLDPLGQGHDVGVRLLVDVDLDAGAAVGAGEDLPLLVRPHHVRHVLDPHLPPLDAGQHRLFHLAQVLVLVQGAHHVLGAPLLDGAAGHVDVLLRQPGDDGVDAQAGAAQALFVDADVDPPLP